MDRAASRQMIQPDRGRHGIVALLFEIRARPEGCHVERHSAAEVEPDAARGLPALVRIPPTGAELDAVEAPLETKVRARTLKPVTHIAQYRPAIGVIRGVARVMHGEL